MTDPSAMRRAQLQIHLQCAVPLRMLELGGVPHHELVDAMERLWPLDDEGRRDPWVRYADSLMYATGPKMRESLAALVTGLAVAALVSDGGVMFDGLHWCTDHAHCLEAAS